MIHRLSPIVALFIGLAAALPAAAQEGSVRIAVANTSRIFNEMQETRDFRQHIENESREFEQQMRQMNERVQALQGARDQLDPNSRQYQERHQEFVQAATEMRITGEIKQAEVQRLQKQKMKQIFDKIQAAVAEVAGQRGIDLVLAEPPPLTFPQQLDEVPIEQIVAAINQRHILFASGRADITSDVVALLDARYREAE